MHLPSVDEHAVHPTGDVSILDGLLVVIKQPMLTNICPGVLQMVLLLAFNFLNFLIII